MTEIFRHRPIRATLGLAALLWPSTAITPAWAQTSTEPAVVSEAPSNAEATPYDAESTPAEAAAEQPKGFWERDTLTGEWGGLRPALDDAGFKLTGNYTGEMLGNPKGGIRNRWVATGNLEIDVDADFAKLIGWEGLTFHLSSFQLHGRGMSNNFLGNQFTVRDIEAAPATRIWSMWFQQAFADNAASVRVGQMPWQEEFVVSAYGASFINGTFGWPIGFAANFVNAGGAYPLATTGARLSVNPADKMNIMVAAFDGDPAAGNQRGQDPTRKNVDGLNVRLKTPPVFFVEGRYGSPMDSDEGLPTMVKLGGWVHTGRFDDPHWSTNGTSLGSGTSTGIPMGHRGNWELYAIVDTMLWRDDTNPKRNIGAFTRLMGGPDDRNQMPYYGELGLNWQGMIEGRDDDIAGIALAYGRMSRALAAQDHDARLFGTSLAPSRDFELAFEALYRYAVTPWWTMIPDAQYIVHPGGGAAYPGTQRRIPDAAVLGVRSVFKL